MKKKLLGLFSLLLLAMLPTFGQATLTQSFIMAPAGAPPTVLAGQSGSTSTATGATASTTGGAVATGAWRICVQFYSLANTGSPCSVDTAATSVLTTTGSTSVVTVYPPVSSLGTGSIVGYRVWIGAASGAAGNEKLVTPAATNCTLSASSTPSCALTSPSVFTVSTGFGAGTAPTAGLLLTYPLANQANMTLFENSAYPTQILSWSYTGSAPATCTVQIYTGAAPSSLSGVGQSLTCTAAGSYALPSTAVAAYVAPDISAWTTNTDQTTVETFTLTTLPYISPIYWGPAAPTSACAAPMAAFFLMGASSNLYTCVTTTWTAITLP